MVQNSFKPWFWITGLVVVAYLIFTLDFSNPLSAIRGCVNDRADPNKWSPNVDNRMRLCPGKRVGFYSENFPVITHEGGEKIRWRLFEKVLCKDLFGSELINLDAWACRTGHWRNVGSVNETPPPGTSWNWSIYVRETAASQAFKEGVPISVRLGFVRRTPKLVADVPLPTEKAPEFLSCPQKWYRTTNCVQVKFVGGTTYYRPPVGVNAAGVPNCVFGNGDGILHRTNLSDGQIRYQLIGNRTLTVVFFELEQGQHVPGAIC